MKTMDVSVIDSDYEIYSETSDSEDLDGSDFTYGGHAQIILSSLDESIGKIDDFLKFERGFIHGDVVTCAAAPSGQLGRVLDIDMVVELEAISGGLVKDINSKKLARVRSFAVGDYVVHGPWIGRVDRVFDVVTVLFDDGTKSEILVRDSETLAPLLTRFEDTPFQHYPGQRVKVNCRHDSKLASWFCGTKGRHDEGTVFHVEVGLVYVSWISSVIIGGCILSPTPPHFQDASNLTLLPSFSYANWQIGDCCRLAVDFSHNLQNNLENEQPLRMAPICSTKMQELEMRCQEMYVITKTKSKVDILWQNGERSFGLDPQTLSPVNNVTDHDFWPEQFVLEKMTSEEVCAQKAQRLGIVKIVDPYERTVKVKWIAPVVQETVGFSCGSIEETVSAYELIEHPYFSHNFGDVVIRHISAVEKMKDPIDMQSTDEVPEQNQPYLGKSSLMEKDIFGQHIGGVHKNDLHGYLSLIGNVIGFKDECVEVRWASGCISEVPPYEIFGIDRIISSQPLSSDDETIPGTTSKDKESADWQEQLSNKKEKIVENNWTTNVLKSVDVLFQWPDFGFLAHVTKNLFGFSGSTSFCDSKKEISQYKLLKKEELQFEISDEQLDNLAREAKDSEQRDESTILPGEDRIICFNKFDMVNVFSDHHFSNGIGNGSILPQVKRGWFKKVQQEWIILKKDLPDTIYVRVCEERMDLLRAAIVGAPGTPYHDGLFFFDIFFPPDYPNDPPAVHFISGGLRLNPNLYESGKVCLSLLNTWMGTGTEVWNPENSTILQVLLSLQALVLNEKPYFNEAGYDEEIGKAGGEKNSVTYNENTFLQSCKSMLYSLRLPPKHFEALVKEHFAKRSHHILSACKAYLDGTPVGHAHEWKGVADDGCGTCSTGFKIMLAKLFPELISAFNKIGADGSIDFEQVGFNASNSDWSL